LEFPRADPLLPGGNVGKVRQDQVGGRGSAKQVGLRDPDARSQSMPFDIGGGNAQGGLAHVPRLDANATHRFGNSNRDRAAAGAQVDHPPGLRMSSQPLDGQLDEPLAFRAWNQDRGAHDQHLAIELALTGQVRYRYSGRPTSGKPAQPLPLRWGQPLLGMTVQPLPRTLEN